MPTTNDPALNSPPTTRRSPPPSPRRRRVGRPILAPALGLIGLGLAVVAWGVAAEPVTDGATIRPSGPVDQVVLEVEAGAIEIVPGDQLLLRPTHPERDFVVESDLNDGTLRTHVACPRLALFRACPTPVRLVVPPGVTVFASTQAGTITASGLGAGADLRTEAGSIDVHELAGPVHLRSEAGSLRGSVLAGTIEARTSTGAIDLRVIEDARHLVVRTEVGSIDLVVPDASYRVDVGATLGGTDVAVAHAPGADRILTARSELGRVSIRTESPTTPRPRDAMPTQAGRGVSLLIPSTASADESSASGLGRPDTRAQRSDVSVEGPAVHVGRLPDTVVGGVRGTLERAEARAELLTAVPPS